MPSADAAERLQESLAEYLYTGYRDWCEKLHPCMESGYFVGWHSLTGDFRQPFMDAAESILIAERESSAKPQF